MISKKITLGFIAFALASQVLLPAAFGAGSTARQIQASSIKNGSGVLTLPTSTDTMVGRATTDTLTNKTIDADANVISNIENADIKAGAAIARTKVANGTADHVVINDGSGTLSSEATLSKSRGGAGADMSSVTFPASGTIVTTTATQQLTNKDIDGGTASDSLRITLPKNTTTNLSALTRKQGTVAYDTTRNKVVYDNGTTLTAVGSGSGSSSDVGTNTNFEDGTTGWTASGGATTTTTNTAANVGSGIYSYDWNSNSASQTLTNTAVTVTSGDGLSGQNGAASCRFKAASGTATHKIQAYDGTNILGSATITSSTSGFVRTSVNFPFPASGSVSLRVISVVADEPEIFIDDCYLGLAEGFNTSQVSQSTMYGAAIWPGTASCQWGTTSGSFGAFAADADCTSPTGSNLAGFASAPATKIPGITFATLPPGEYLVMAKGTFARTTGGTGNCSWRFSDGTTGSPASVMLITNQNQYTHQDMTARYSYTAAQSNVTFSLQARSSNATENCAIDTGSSGVQDLEFKVYRFPTSTEQAYRPDASPISWAGYSAYSSNVTSASYADLASAANTVTQTDARNMTCTALANLPGITCTVPKAGKYNVCANTFVQPNATGAVYTSVQLYDGTNSIAEAGMRNPAGGGMGETTVPLCGPVNVTGTSFTVKIRAKSTSGAVNIYAGTQRGAVEWKVENADQPVAAPLLVGSVTSNSSGLERVERARVTYSGGTPTIVSQSGSWISSLTDNGTGDTQEIIASGIFSATPTCFCNNEAGNSFRKCLVIPTSSTSIRTQTFGTGTGTPDVAADHDFGLVCMGPR